MDVRGLDVKKIILILFFCLMIKVEANAFTLDLRGWSQISDKHFKVVFKKGMSENVPRGILNKAEDYYSTIANRIGYERYQNFWTWDDRVPIVYFSSQEEFAKTTGRPAWSKGFSISHLSSVNFRMIVTYQGQEDFLKTTLPHEISHLILHDFIGANRYIPSWFDEGVAQLEEERDDQNHKTILANLVRSGQSIPLLILQNLNSNAQPDARYASIFYAESLYIVDFLVKTYGKEDFINLCRNLRNGKNFDEAFKSSYYPAVESMAALQDKWIQYMMHYL